MTSSNSTLEPFISHLGEVVEAIGAEEFGPSLEDKLNAAFPAGGEWYSRMHFLCREGRDEGWLCARESGGIRFGRVVQAGGELGALSVDVVEMNNVAGPHHSHPNGEIDLVMPEDSTALFDGRGAGWKVYKPGSAHHPTVTGGAALVLYLLPEGAIEFTRA